MVNRRSILVISGIIVIAALVAGHLFSREPAYDGRSLSHWVMIYGDPYSTERLLAEEAIGHIGTNAIPYLMEWSQQRTPPWKREFNARINALLRRLNFEGRGRRGDVQREVAASKAFGVLGPQAKTAIPRLAELVQSPECPDPVWTALANLGEPALPIFLVTLTNHNPIVRANALVCLPRLGTNAEPAVPLLLETLKGEDSHLAFWASESLGALRLQAPVVVPALAKNLQHTNSLLRRSAASALGSFGAAARPAESALLGALQDPDNMMQKAVTRALLKIHPQALTNATR